MLTVEVTDSGTPLLSATTNVSITVTQVIAPAPTSTADPDPTPTETTTEDDIIPPESVIDTTPDPAPPTAAPTPPPSRAADPPPADPEPVAPIMAVINDVADGTSHIIIATHLDEVVETSVTTERTTATSRNATENAIVSFGSDLAFEMEALSDDLRNMREDIDSSVGFQYFAAASAVTATGSLTVGYVLWAIRGGWLASSILAQMPAWRLIDPLVVLSSLDGTDGLGDDQSLQDMIKDGVKPKDDADSA